MEKTQQIRKVTFSDTDNIAHIYREFNELLDRNEMFNRNNNNNNIRYIYTEQQHNKKLIIPVRCKTLACAEHISVEHFHSLFGIPKYLNGMTHEL